MISPTKKAEHVLHDALAGERREFTIKTTGKAFRVLIDGLYENKIGAVVREIMSNGYDAHAKAGRADWPLEVTAPTAMDPTFRVRDFGVAMTHDEIMDVYSQLFNSTKEASNDEVGMFGLGSKSPFAYTDTFQITSYLNGEKRVYVAHISNDDVPQITHIHTEPQGDELQGVEVSIPVKPVDVQRFHREIRKMVFASDVMPDVMGMGTDIPEILHQGDGYRIIEDEFNYGEVAVRQGCVIYPVHGKRASTVSYGYTLVVDVPIGSVEVTASRESLSLTPDTEAYVNRVISEANDKIRTWAESLEFENRLDAFRKRNSYAFLSVAIGRGHVDLKPDKKSDRVSPQYLETHTSKTKTRLQATFQHIDTLTVVVERPGEKIPRSRMRIQAFYNRAPGQVAIVKSPDLPRVVRLFGLKPNQVIPLSTLPDVAVQRSGGSRAVTAAPKSLPKGHFYVEKTGACSIAREIVGSYVRTTQRFFNSEDHWDYEKRGISHTLKLLGFKPDEIEFFTEAQIKDRKIPLSQSFEVEAEKRAKAYAKKHNLQAKMDQEATNQMFARLTRHWEFRTEVQTRLVSGKLRYGQSVNDHLLRMAVERATEAVSTMNPGASHLTDDDKRIARALKIEGKSSLTESDFWVKVEAAIEPLKDLAAMADPIQHLIEVYINNK